MSNFVKSLSFIGLTIAMFMGTLDSTIVNIALPKIMTHFNASLANTSWVTTIYTLALAVFMITTSKIADRYGRKKIMLLGLLLFGGFSAACMMANSLTELIIFRFFQGIGGAIITPIVLPMMVVVFGQENMSKVASVVGAITALAAAGGPPIGGIILQNASWRWIFGINVPLTLISFVIVMIWIKESYDESLAGKIDILGTIFITLGLAGITFGLLEGREYGWHSSLILGSLFGGLAAIILFVLIEKKVTNPLLELDLFREKTLSASSFVYFLTGFALVSPLLILNYFLQNVLNYSALSAALIIIPVSLTITVAMPLGTKLFNRVGAVPVTFLGLLITAASLLCLSFIKTTTPRAVMVVFLIINGVGFGFSSVSLVASVKHLPENKNGIGSGIVNAARQIGTCLGAAILVTALDANINGAKTQIHRRADHIVNQQRLSPRVKTTAHKELKKMFASSNSAKLAGSKAQKQLRFALTAAAKSQEQLPEPAKNSDLHRLYQAESQINHAHKLIEHGSLQLTKSLAATGSGNPVLAQAAVLSQGLTQGNLKIVQGQAKLLTGIKLLAQKEAFKSVLNQVKQTKNDKIGQAFSQTYLLSALIILCLSPVALWTDRKKDKQ
ncbi:MAG: MFS transporter [Oenococcus sp.]|uniref:MFS transporter n=1 Tax=Oenococcus sp. TaxID=1979414 RepID=UPI0039ECA99E